ncbi:MAG: SpoIIE family protein phosphatase [Candidatus Riflebacteria bacterium]|nr:SpoIIE family protein phosphatase [Candidatus Riflebacteria bacterium]
MTTGIGPMAVMAGLTIVLALAWLDARDRAARLDRQEQDWQTMREILIQAANRGQVAPFFGTLLERLCQQPWTTAGFARRAAALARRYPRLVDLYLFDAAGKRVPLPGHRAQVVVASQRFLQAILDPGAKVPPKIIGGFAGNPEAARRLAGAPGVLVDLLNGDEKTWAGWWRLGGRDGSPAGFLVAFVHRGGIDPPRMLDAAVRRLNTLVGGRMTLGWWSPLRPGEIRPAGAAFPPGLATALPGLSPSLDQTWWEGRPLALLPGADKAMLFCLGSPPALPGTGLGHPRLLVCLLAFLAGAGGWFVLTGPRLGRKLALGYLLAGAVPSAVFLATVTSDRDYRERLLVERVKESQEARLRQIDAGLVDEYTPLVAGFRRAVAEIGTGPLAAAGPILERTLLALGPRRNLVSSLALIDRAGKTPVFHSFQTDLPAEVQRKSRDLIAMVGKNILRAFNLNLTGAASSPSDVRAGAENTEAVVAGFISETQKPYEWFLARGRLMRMSIGEEARLTYFDALPDRRGAMQAVLLVRHDARVGQIRYLRRLVARPAGRRWSPASGGSLAEREAAGGCRSPRRQGGASGVVRVGGAPDAVRIRAAPDVVRGGGPSDVVRIGGASTAGGDPGARMAALPLHPSDQWPAFPGLAAGRHHVLRRLRDLAATTGLPQHQRARLGRTDYLLTAMPGGELDGYVLVLARPYREILDQTGRLTVQAAFLAVLLLLVAGGVAAWTSRRLLDPIANLQNGLAAMRDRRFTVRVPPAPIADLAEVADGFNRVLDGMQDLQTARVVQEALWPEGELAGEGWSVRALARTASDLGGDFHDWFRRADGRLVFAIGDVAGHGIASALVGASAKSLLGLLARETDDPVAILTAMNATFLGQTGRMRPMTFWIGVFDPVSRHLRYSCAGHPYPAFWPAAPTTVAGRAAGSLLDVGAVPGEAAAATGKLDAGNPQAQGILTGKTPADTGGPAGAPAIPLGWAGYPLGARKNPAYRGGDLVLAGRGRVVLFTDGLIEASGTGGQPFGYDRFAAAAAATLALPSAVAAASLFGEVVRWSGREVPEDDQTLVLLEVGGPS